MDELVREKEELTVFCFLLFLALIHHLIGVRIALGVIQDVLYYYYRESLGKWWDNKEEELGCG